MDHWEETTKVRPPPEVTTPSPPGAPAWVREGRAVVFIRPVDRYPHGSAEVGETGVVVRVEEDLVAIRLDEFHAGLKEWDNEILFYSEDDPSTMADLRQSVWPRPERTHTPITDMWAYLEARLHTEWRTSVDAPGAITCRHEVAGEFSLEAVFSDDDENVVRHWRIVRDGNVLMDEQHQSIEIERWLLRYAWDAVRAQIAEADRRAEQAVNEMIDNLGLTGDSAVRLRESLLPIVEKNL